MFIPDTISFIEYFKIAGLDNVLTLINKEYGQLKFYGHHTAKFLIDLYALILSNNKWHPNYTSMQS